MLAEETKRRIYNQDRAHTAKERLVDLDKFVQKLADSGYGKDTRKEILTAGIKRYYRLVLQQVNGGRSLYRSAREMAPKRSLKQLAPKTWFRPTRGGNKVSVAKDHPVPVHQRLKLKKKSPNQRMDGKKPEATPTSSPPKTIKVVESPIFVPFTRDSKLRKTLQQLDDQLGECMKSPAVRFVERCGGQTLGELLGSSNPWARDFRCGREGCIPCQGRDLLAEEDSLRPIPAPGQPIPPKPGKDETRSLPKCTVEGIGYVLECWTCRLTGPHLST